MDILIKNSDIYIYICFLYFLRSLFDVHIDVPPQLPPPPLLSPLALYNARNIIPGEDSEGWKVIKRFVRFDPDDTQRQKAVRGKGSALSRSPSCLHVEVYNYTERCQS